MVIFSNNLQKKKDIMGLLESFEPECGSLGSSQYEKHMGPSELS